MADEELSPLSSLWDAPLRRDVRVAAAPLPTAAPIGHAAAKPPAVHRGRLIAGFAAVIVIGLSATTASILTSGAGIAGTALTAEADALGHGAAALSGGARVGPHDIGRAGGGRAGGGRADADRHAEADAMPEAGEPPVPDERTDADAPGESPPVSEEEPLTPDVGSQAPAPHSDDRDSPTPPDTGAAAPTPDPSPSAPPAPQPAPPAPNPPTTSPGPASAAPLAFTGLTEDRVTVLGLPLLSSYALSLSGEPGSRASVTYGSLPAGSVTFDGSGRATLTIGRTLLGITLSNPVIRATYSDGTAGSAVEARRDAI